MAEIKIEKKKTIWPWVLLALLVLAAIIYFTAYDDDDGDMDDTTQTEVVADNDLDSDAYEADSMTRGGETMALGAATTTVISEYVDFIKDFDGTMGLDHVFSHEALTKLINATEQVAKDVNVNIQADLQAAREKADFIMVDPESLKHADKIRAAGMATVDVLQKVQTQKFPSLASQADTVRSAVMSIEPSEQTLNQKKSVKNFFDEAANLLIQMKEENYEHNR
ncbi:MAG: hypothetical protein HKM28_01060 [Flavobacteriaceae bacterium]|nr:hypothetical protein [Flavobacteriaceae bacterium]